MIMTARTQFYATLLKSARRTLSSTRDATASMANIAALLFHSFHKQFGNDSLNWAGFYLTKQPVYQRDAEKDIEKRPLLVLGPFHGQPAVTLIVYSQGVCGTCLAEKVSQLVPDVHAHPNHIACDERSQSELVVPLLLDGRVIGMIDMDSPVKDGFNHEDRLGVEALAQLLVEHADWSSLTGTVALDAPIEDEIVCASNGH